MTNNTVTVNSGGTLLISGVDCLSDTNRLTIFTGSTVQLDDGVKEVIASLYIDGAGPNIGIWGSLSSSAENRSPLFAGRGKLYVGVPIPASGTVLIIR